jgi:DNA polymerase-1
MIFDCDLAQADAQVVAWECNDDELKDIFKDPDADLHDANAITIFGRTSKRNRQLAKGGVHATNYGAKPRTLAAALGVTVYEAERFQKLWFAAHPNIRAWQQRIDMELAHARRVYNKFGNYRHYFDRVEHLLPQALAWIPQSTVALVINRGLVGIDTEIPDVEVLMQVHDSLVMQVHKDKFKEVLPKVKALLEVPIPYDDPLIIPVGIEASPISWGDVEPYDWNTGLLLPKEK